MCTTRARPFHQPTDVAVGDNGDIFVSDGYRNARVHKFSADGTLLKSWGEPGNAKDLRNSRNDPGKFHTPHGIWVQGDRVFLLDRENNRIQIFTTDGLFAFGGWHMVTYAAEEDARSRAYDSARAGCRSCDRHGLLHRAECGLLPRAASRSDRVLYTCRRRRRDASSVPAAQDSCRCRRRRPSAR